MEEGEHQAARLHDLVNAGQDGSDERLRQIVRRIPQNDDVEDAAGEVEIGREETIDIEGRLGSPAHRG